MAKARERLECALSSFCKIKIEEKAAYFTPNMLLQHLGDMWGDKNSLPSPQKLTRSLFSLYENGKVIIYSILAKETDGIIRLSFIGLIMCYPEEFSQSQKLSPQLLRKVKRRVHRTLRRLLKNRSRPTGGKLGGKRSK